MARDRKRAKQRRQRQPQLAEGAPERLHRADVPGSLQHSSGDVDEFDAALVRGAHGAAGQPAGELAAEPEPEPEEYLELDEVPADEAELNREAEAAFGGDRGGDGGGGDVVRRDGGDGGAPARRQRTGNRVIAFLRASWAELQRVQWPDRRQVAQATAVVLGFVAIAGVYLGVADWVAQKIVNAIL